MDCCCNWASEVLKTYIVGRLESVYSSIKNYEGNLELLQANHELLCAKKDDITRKVEDGKSKLEEVTNEAKLWLQSVETLLEANQVKDLMKDDFIRAKDQCCFGLSLCNLCQRYGMSRLAEAKADEMQAKLAQPPQDPVTVPIRTMDLDSIPSEHCKGLKSREELQKRILDLLKDDLVAAIGICGMGGAGKTTLATEIKNNGAKDMFDEIPMVEVSQNPNIESIQDHIAGSIGLSLDIKHSRDQRAKSLYNALKQVKRRRDNDHRTKILIIIDNIWEELKLKAVGIPHERTSEFSCKVVFTSRKKQVCKSMGVPDENIFNVSMLNEDESRYLFWEHVKNVNVQEVNRSLEKRLLKVCGGLPLAITALAKMLRFEHLSEWPGCAEKLEKPLSNRSKDVDREELGAYNILKTSYKSIGNNDVKTFFLLACLYPLGLEIPIEDLMRYGIGLGLFRDVDSLTGAIRQAREWAKYLISSSLLLESDVNEDSQSTGYFERDYRVQADFVKIHDLVRSFAILYAEEEAEGAKDGRRLVVGAFPQRPFDESGQEYTDISLTNDQDHSCLKGMKLNVLQTLLLEFRGSLQLDDDIFQGMTSLKVLQLSSKRSMAEDYYCLPKSITGLSLLRTLHLEKCRLEDGDIELISELVGLLVLSLRGSQVKMLPHGMKKLSNLRLLDLTSCRLLETIPANVMGSLTQLEGLYMFDSYTSRWRNNSDEAISVTELSLLPRLKVLEIHVERIEQLPADIEFTNNLDEFKIRVGRGRCEVEAQLWGAFDMELEYWECVWRYPWLKGLLSRSGRLQLRSLDRGDEKIKELENVVPYLAADGFQNLKELELVSLGGLTRLCEREVVPTGMFSNLRNLKLVSLDNLGPYVLLVNVAPKLTTLVVKYCDKLRFIWMEIEDATSTSAAQREIPVNAIHTFPCLKELELGFLSLQNILGKAQASTSTDMTVPQAFLNPKTEFPCLEKLFIKGSIHVSSSNFFYSHTFQSLRVLKLKRLEWKHVFSADAVASGCIERLKHLEKLKIDFCSEMEVVVEVEVESFRGRQQEEEEEGNGGGLPGNGQEVVVKKAAENGATSSSSSSLNLVFPQLKSIHLKSCHKMRSFFSAGHRHVIVHLPSLEEVGIDCCHNLEFFSYAPIKAPKLAQVRVKKSEWSIPVYMDEYDDINSFIHDVYKGKNTVDMLEEFVLPMLNSLAGEEDVEVSGSVEISGSIGATA